MSISGVKSKSTNTAKAKNVMFMHSIQEIIKSDNASLKQHKSVSIIACKIKQTNHSSDVWLHISKYHIFVPILLTEIKGILSGNW